MPTALPADSTQRPTFRHALGVWTRVAALSFGGPAGQIAVMHRILVDELRWVGEPQFLHALNYCMLLPGPEAQQLATYIGWLMHGAAGGLAAGMLFILPGFLSILGLSIVYATWGQTALVAGLFYGLKPAIVAIVVQAVVRIGRRSLKNRAMLTIAASAFIAIFFFDAPFPLIVLVAGIVGYVGGRYAPKTFAVIQPHAAKTAAPGDGVPSDAPLLDHAALAPPNATLGRAVRVAALWLLIWWGPIAGIVATTGRDSVYSREALFFSKAAVVTFGGAYSVLAYVAHKAVDVEHWLAPREMLDGLGMAETTPGPLIQVVQFIGYMGAARNPGSLSPLAAGVLGSIITAWVTFAPCFLWIFVGAPYVERLREHASLSAALSAITAAVVGVILKLSIWFALHTLFVEVAVRHVGPLRLLIPDATALDPAAAIIAVLAFAALFRWGWGIGRTLLTCAILGLALHSI